MLTNPVVITFSMITTIFYCSAVGMQPEPNETALVAALINRSQAQQRWTLHIRLPKETESQLKIIEEVQITLKSHILRYGRNEKFWFSLKGSEQDLIRKMNGKFWFNRNELKKDEILYSGIK